MIRQRFLDEYGASLEVSDTPAQVSFQLGRHEVLLSNEQVKILIEVLQKHVNPEPARHVVEDFNFRMSSLDADFQQLRRRIKDLEDKVKAHDSRLCNVNGRVNALELIK